MADVRGRPAWPIAVAVGGGTLLVAAVVGVAATLVAPPAGDSIAEASLRSGEPFELRYASDGQAQRVFLDMECERCSLPVTGELTATAGDDELVSVEIDAGEDAMATTDEHLDEQLLTTIAAAPEGAEVVVRGSLTVHGERGLLDQRPRDDAPDPIVRRFALRIAR